VLGQRREGGKLADGGAIICKVWIKSSARQGGAMGKHAGEYPMLCHRMMNGMAAKKREETKGAPMEVARILTR